MNPRRRRLDDGPVPVLAVDLTSRSWAPAPKAVSPEVEKADCNRRWAHLQEQGWKLTEEEMRQKMLEAEAFAREQRRQQGEP